MRKSTIALLSALGLILALLLAFVLVGGLTLRSRLDAMSLGPASGQPRIPAPREDPSILHASLGTHQLVPLLGQQSLDELITAS